MSATAEPLTSAPEYTLPQQIGRLYHDMLPVFEQFVGMSIARWRILTSLRTHGEMSQAALQQCIRVDAASITRQVKQMEEERLITRRADPHDNRFTLVALTDAGRAFAEHVYDKRDAFEARILADLSDDDIATLQRCLAQMRARTRALGDELAAR